MSRRHLLALPLVTALAISHAHATETEIAEVQSEAEAYAVSSYAALYNLDGRRVVDQLNRNIMWFGSSAAYLAYRQALEEAGIMERLASPQDRLVTEIIDLATTPYAQGGFLVKFAVRQTIDTAGRSEVACFDAVVTIQENKEPDLRSSPFMNAAQPTRLDAVACDG